MNQFFQFCLNFFGFTRANSPENLPEESNNAYEAFLKHRDYLLVGGDQSQRQLDQLVFTVSSAALGFCIIQLSSAYCRSELILLGLAALLLILTIAVTYISLLASANSFYSRVDDADKARSVPYNKSEVTIKHEKLLDSCNHVQLACFLFACLMLVIFTCTRGYAVFRHLSNSRTIPNQERNSTMNQNEIDKKTIPASTPGTKPKDPPPPPPLMPKENKGVTPKDPPPLPPTKPPKTDK